MASGDGQGRRRRRASERSVLSGLLLVLAGGEVGVLSALAILVIVFFVLNHAFLSAINIRAILDAVAFVGIIGVGQTVLLVAGEFDLSVGSVAGLCAAVSGWLMTTGHLPVAVAVLGGLAAGAGLGLVNGVIVVRFGIPAFIATLGMLFVAQGMTQVIPYERLPHLSVTGLSWQCRRRAAAVRDWLGFRDPPRLPRRRRPDPTPYDDRTQRLCDWRQ